MQDSLIGHLRCPHCSRSLSRTDTRTLGCAEGHRYDEAKQGYVTLLPPRHRNLVADDADMIAARLRIFEAGHFEPVHRTVAAAASAFAEAAPGVVLDAGCGPGTYPARVLRALEEDGTARDGLGFDLSPAAARRAAKAHPRMGAFVADTFSPWPLGDGIASVVLDVFAPRNGAEMHRVLAPGGHLVVVTPEPDHLQELRAATGMIGIDERKEERLAASLGTDFEPVMTDRVRWTMELSPAAAADLAGMGPSGHHEGRGNSGASSQENGAAEAPSTLSTTGHVAVRVLTRVGSRSSGGVQLSV
ncbi:putative RNA methyltransferase [Brevibacterium litoralis]|uniref:putative RNA methyltransferase n=1 Tax=Brevibacterium litoralis TaxID=3138935 RepID=UPI0032F0329C